MLGSKSDSTSNWCPQPPELLALVRPIKPWSIQMNRYNRGIDNKSIDVHLSPKFVANVQRITHGMIQQDVASNYWGKTSNKATLSTADLEQFRSSYESLMDAAMQSRENPAAIDWTRLIQLSVFKFLIQSVAMELQELRQRLETSRDDAHASGNRLQYHQRLTTLAMEGGAIYYRVCRRLFGIIERIEATRLRRLRKSRLGVSWPVPQEALFNILLQLRNLLNEEMGMYHYPMLLLGEHGKKHRINLNLCIIDVFKNYLPTWLQQGSNDGQNVDEDAGENSVIRVMNRLDQGNLRGFMETEIVLNQLLNEAEYKQPQYSWLDEPSNLVRLLTLSSSQNQEKSAMVPEFQDEETAKRWRSFMRVIRDELFQRIEAMNITQDIIASYWASRVCQGLPPTTSPRLIYEFLSGQQDKQKVLRRLAGSGSQEQDITAITKALDGAMIEIKQLTPEHKRKFFGRILIDFLTLRRDLKLSYKIFEAMDQISILLDERSLALSRANNLLHEFLLSDEQQGENRISCHVILKADLRGSTKVTNELRAKKLNPATHFSQNFFNPINVLLEDFGAKKVFVEGDAVILSILENTGSAKGGLIVAWACGLGTEILNIVARHNLVSRRYGLPDLELGLGIAFVNEEPTFLHDGDHPIMISSAINLADRLSSCAKALRNAEFAQVQRPFRVEVLLPPEGSDATAGAKTDVLRYNVNGIEIDEAAFNRLKSEISLRQLYVKIAGQTETLHVGRYPDRSDRMRWLVVRESPLHVWEWGQISKQPAPGKRFFYEVVVDQDLVDKIRAKLGGKEERAAPETSNANNDDS